MVIKIIKAKTILHKIQHLVSKISQYRKKREKLGDIAD